MHRLGSSPGGAATLSYSTGTTVATRAVTGLAGGALRVNVRDADTHVVVDLVGWYAPTSVAGGKRFQAISPRRVLDTRTGVGAKRASVRRNGTIVVQVAGKGRILPSSASAVLLNLSATSTDMAIYRTSWPKSLKWPKASDVYITKGRATANLVLVRVGQSGKAKGKISLRNYAVRPISWPTWWATTAERLGRLAPRWMSPRRARITHVQLPPLTPPQKRRARCR